MGYGGMRYVSMRYVVCMYGVGEAWRYEVCRYGGMALTCRDKAGRGALVTRGA